MRRFPLEPTAPEMREMIERAMDRIVQHVASLPSQPAWNTHEGVKLAHEHIEKTPPETGP